MHVLLTRTADDAQPMAAAMRALGVHVSEAPLLSIVALPIAPDLLAGARALVATSRNGVRALAQSAALSAAQQLPLYAVGPATAQAARAAGFTRVITGAGTAADLVPLLAGDPLLHGARIAHLAGDHVAFDLAAALAARGVEVIPVPAYRSVAAETLPAETAATLTAGHIDAVVLMSPRAARTWAALAAPLAGPPLAALMHVCLSDAVATALRHAVAAQPGLDLGPDAPKVVVAARPHGEEIVAAVKRLAAAAKAR